LEGDGRVDGLDGMTVPWCGSAIRTLRDVPRATHRAWSSAEDELHIPVRVEPPNGVPDSVDYRWDSDTDILSATVRPAAQKGDVPRSTALELEGSDGSWLILDVRGGRISGIEVAIWPNVRTRADLAPPKTVEDATVIVGAVEQGKRVSVEVDTLLAAEADRAERTIHFRLGASRETRTVRIARDILVDIDRRDRIAGFWLLDVPPYPDDL
jgi:hypothetical protein